MISCLNQELKGSVAIHIMRTVYLAACLRPMFRFGAFPGVDLKRGALYSGQCPETPDTTIRSKKYYKLDILQTLSIWVII